MRLMHQDRTFCGPGVRYNKDTFSEMALSKKSKSKRRPSEPAVAKDRREDVVDDDLTNADLEKQHAKQLPGTLKSVARKSKYNTARGAGVRWTPHQEDDHVVKAFIRDTALLKATHKWDELVGKGVTHLVIEDDDNTLKVIPPEVTQLQTLRSFHLMWSQVKVVPNQLLQMDLRELCLQKCNLKNIDNIYLAPRLTKLELINCGIRKIPVDIGSLTDLVHIDLTGNHLKSLPVSISNLQKLETLKLCGNSLQEIPNSFTELECLDTLDASQNQIKSLPKDFGKLTELVTVRLSHNQLSVLPNSMQDLTRLKHLFLSFNRFNEIPKILGKLRVLETLNMVANHIIHIPCALVSLKTLLLDKNDLTELSDVLFMSERLEKLSVQYNKLESIPPLVARLGGLRALYVGGNNITHLPEDLCAISSLRHVVVKETKLQELPTNFDRLSRLSVVDIDNTELDPQYGYALKNDGIQGLFNILRLKHEINSSGVAGERKSIYPPGMAPPEMERRYDSDRGSSALDSEDEDATDDEVLEDNNNRKVMFRESQLGDGKETLAERRRRKDPKTLMPFYDNNVDGNTPEPLAIQSGVTSLISHPEFRVPNGTPSTEMELTIGKNRGSMVISQNTTSFMDAIASLPDVVSEGEEEEEEYENPYVNVPRSGIGPAVAKKPVIQQKPKPPVMAKPTLK